MENYIEGVISGIIVVMLLSMFGIITWKATKNNIGAKEQIPPVIVYTGEDCKWTKKAKNPLNSWASIVSTDDKAGLLFCPIIEN